MIARAVRELFAASLFRRRHLPVCRRSLASQPFSALKNGYVSFSVTFGEEKPASYIALVSQYFPSGSSSGVAARETVADQLSPAQVAEAQ